MKGIEKITIQNFKAFGAEKTFNLRGKHLLVYGPNGSGKSSLYFALYTILQCDTKPKQYNETLSNGYIYLQKQKAIL